MSLEKLNQSLLDMTYEQKLTLLRDIRSDRRVSKKEITHRVKVKKGKEDTLIGQFKKLSEEDQAALLKALGQ